ncbi:MAG: hypothetical protein R3A10_14825, partial [Caldilineaceae bacterium]
CANRPAPRQLDASVAKLRLQFSAHSGRIKRHRFIIVAAFLTTTNLGEKENYNEETFRARFGIGRDGSIAAGGSRLCPRRRRRFLWRPE